MVQSGGQAEDIALVCALGLGINNDNMPAPENIPDGTNAVTTNTDTRGASEHLEEGWGWSGIDHRKQLNISNVVPASISGISTDVVEKLSFVGIFFVLFPKSILQIIEESNKKLNYAMNMCVWVIRWIGVCLLLSTLSGNKRSDFLSMEPISPNWTRTIRMCFLYPLGQEMYEKVSVNSIQFKYMYW